jgi:hypothetical protein
MGNILEVLNRHFLSFLYCEPTNAMPKVRSSNEKRIQLILIMKINNNILFTYKRVSVVTGLQFSGQLERIAEYLIRMTPSFITQDLINARSCFLDKNRF